MAGNVTTVLSTRGAEEVAASIGGTDQFGGKIERTVTDSGSTDFPYFGEFALTAGALTLDLTALPRTGRTALDLTGQMVVSVTIENLGANAMTFRTGASTGYAINLDVPGLGVAYSRGAGGFGEVGASNSDVDVVGTGTQSFRIILATKVAP
jgi:hypothetical protein